MMTSQLGDIYRYNNHSYYYLRSTGDGLFAPEKYGFFPKSCVSACWRGYFCEYEIADNSLKLQKVCIHDGNNYYPPINGIKYSKGQNFFGHHLYDHIDLTLNFTGKILLADDEVSRFYYELELENTPYSFETLLSFEFENGKLTKIVNHSETAARLRVLYEESRAENGLLLDDESLIDQLPDGVRETVWWDRPRKKRELIRAQNKKRFEEIPLR